MYDRPTLLNDHSKIEKTYTESLSHLSERPDALKEIATYLNAYRQIGNLIPQTMDKFGSGHYFPHSESNYELEASYEFALQGFYRYSFIALRLVLELGLLGVFFSVDDNEHTEVRPWLKSQIQTPQRRVILHRLLKLPNFQIFDQKFKLQDRILVTFDNLDGYTHTKGYKFSSSKLLNRANFNRFEPKSLQQYFDMMFSVTRDLIIVLLIKHPLGMQGLPLDEKYGMDGPIGGFLEQYEVDLITSVISPDERKLLKELSDKDVNVQQTVKFINDLPDLTDEQMKKQSEEWDEFMKRDGSSNNSVA